MKLRVLQDRKLTTVETFWQRFQNAELLKYAPEKRCLFLLKIEQSDYFVKLYPKKFLRENRGEKIHLVGQKFWDLANSAKLNFKVPMPVFWDAETRTLWQKRLTGIPAIEFLKKEKGEKIVFQIGQAIANIADSEIVPMRIFDSPEQMKDSFEFAAMIIEKFPPLKQKTARLLSILGETHQSQPAQNLVRTHGDMHIDQWLFDGKSLGLLDFEDFSHSAAERDLAFFVVQIEAEYGAEICLKKIEKDLLAGFKSSGKQINETLLEIYKAHKWLAKAAKVSEEKAARKMLEKALEYLRKQ